MTLKVRHIEETLDPLSRMVLERYLLSLIERVETQDALDFKANHLHLMKGDQVSAAIQRNGWADAR